MLLFLSILIGLLAGVLKKGKLLRLGALRALWLPILTIASNASIQFFPDMQFWVKVLIISFSYVCILVFIFMNRRYVVPALFLGLGTLSNFIVIVANSFRMPVSSRALLVYSGMTAEAVLAKRADYLVATDSTRLLFMGDVINFPKSVYSLVPIMKGFFSIGDIFVSIGMFLLIFSVLNDGRIEIK